MSTTGEGGYPHGSVGEEAALLAAAIEEWVRSAKETFGPLLTTALGAAACEGGRVRQRGGGGRRCRGRGEGRVDRRRTGHSPAGAPSPGAASPGRIPGHRRGAHTADEGSDGTGWAADGLFGHLHAAAGSAQPGVAGECRYCPICRVLAALRGPRSEVMEYLVEAGTSLLAALRAAIEAHERSWVGGPPVPVEHIDIL